jgi:hypothetical protein
MNRFPTQYLFLFLFAKIILGQGTSTGLIPINDLKSGYYKNYQGGYYPSGSNVRPFKHDSLGLAFSKQILPLDINGNVDTSKGKYVFLSIGMSNTTQEFSQFKFIADPDPEKNQKLVIVDGAQGGQTAAIISNPAANFWTVITQRLQQAGLTNKQVAVCWLKEADAGPTQAFPVHANTLLNELVAVVKNIKQKYPNCKIVYCSSRTYGGYATSTLNPEPYAYESSFSVKWLIEKQISGDTSLVCTGNNPKAPWLAWGPYLWADGLSPRSDGLTWTIDDFVTSDRTHPSSSGQKKVADMLLNFLKTDQTARKWFLKNSLTTIKDASSNSTPANFYLYQNYPNPFNPSTVISYQLSFASYVSLKIYDLVGEEVAVLINDYHLPGIYNSQFSIRNLPAGRQGSQLPSGVYYYQLKVGNFVQTKKMMLIK